MELISALVGGASIVVAVAAVVVSYQAKGEAKRSADAAGRSADAAQRTLDLEAERTRHQLTPLIRLVPADSAQGPGVFVHNDGPQELESVTLTTQHPPGEMYRPIHDLKSLDDFDTQGEFERRPGPKVTFGPLQVGQAHFVVACWDDMYQLNAGSDIWFEVRAEDSERRVWTRTQTVAWPWYGDVGAPRQVREDDGQAPGPADI